MSKIAFASLTFLLVFLAASCGDSSVEPGGNPTPPAGRLVRHTDCRSFAFDGGDSLDIVPITSDCIEYFWNGLGTLRVVHINAGFNCCPGEIGAEITVEGGVITIRESESESFCDCSCLYNVEYEIHNLPSGVYTIRAIELYTTPEDPVLEDTINLHTTFSGLFCLDRGHYPWPSPPPEWATPPKSRP